MKRIINTAIVYFIFAMAGGVFYREFTKWNGYRADYIRSAACSSVGDGNIVISYNGSFRKSNNVGGKSFV